MTTRQKRRKGGYRQSVADGEQAWVRRAWLCTLVLKGDTGGTGFPFRPGLALRARRFKLSLHVSTSHGLPLNVLDDEYRHSAADDDMAFGHIVEQLYI